MPKNLLKFLSNFQLPLWLSCSQIDIKVVISIKYGWNTIAWAKLCIWDILFTMHEVSKSIVAAKSQNYVDSSGAQKPTWAKSLEFDFFNLKRQDITNLGSQHLHT